MKHLFVALLFLCPLSVSAQNVYITGGYATDRPTIKDGYEPNGYVAEMNGATQIEKIKQNGFFAGLGTILKTKKTSTFGLRIEGAYERYNLSVARTVTTQQTLYSPQVTFPSDLSLSNSYLRFTPSLSYYKLRKTGVNYQADLGLSQLIHLSGWKESSSFSAVHISAGVGMGGIILKAGTEIGLGNMLKGEGRDYKGYAKRFFVGVNIYPFTLMQKKHTQIYDKLEGHEPD